MSLPGVDSDETSKTLFQSSGFFIFKIQLILVMYMGRKSKNHSQLIFFNSLVSIFYIKLLYTDLKFFDVIRSLSLRKQKLKKNNRETKSIF